MRPELLLLCMAALMVATLGQWVVMDQMPFFQAFDWKTKHEWIGRCTATVVQTLCTIMFALWKDTFAWTIPLFLGYHLFDTGHMATYERDPASYFHHVIGVTTTCLKEFIMSPEQTAPAIEAAIALEVSSPPLHVSWLLNKAGYGDAPWFKYIAGFAAVFFGLVRLGVYPWIVATKMDSVTALAASPFIFLNAYWFYKIVRLAIRKFGGTKAKDASNTEQSHEA